MLETPKLMTLAQNLARHAGARQSQIAKNIAHADVPGYRARDLQKFGETLRQTSTPPMPRLTRSGHISRTSDQQQFRTIDAGGESAPNGNTVSLESEMVKATDAKSSHDLALSVYKSSLDILRLSLGKGR